MNCITKSARQGKLEWQIKSKYIIHSTYLGFFDFVKDTNTVCKIIETKVNEISACFVLFCSVLRLFVCLFVCYHVSSSAIEEKIGFNKLEIWRHFLYKNEDQCSLYKITFFLLFVRQSTMFSCAYIETQLISVLFKLLANFPKTLIAWSVGRLKKTELNWNLHLW